MKKLLTYMSLAVVALILSSCAGSGRTEAYSGPSPLTPALAIGNYCGGDR